jgi:hypothetical protein
LVTLKAAELGGFMRARALVAAGLVLVPCIVGAQPRPRLPIGGQPPRAVPSGPQPRVVSNALRYNRLPLAVEGYTFVSRMEVPGVLGASGQTFTTGGSGTRLEYRFHRMAAATMDFTSNFIGGPIFNQTAELGFRVGPSRASADIVPFLDARAGYFFSLPHQQLGGFSSNPPVNFASVMNYAYGPGAIAGGGVEFATTRLFSITTAASAARSFMTARPTFRATQQNSKYTMNSYRMSISLRYNGVRSNGVPNTMPR